MHFISVNFKLLIYVSYLNYFISILIIKAFNKKKYILILNLYFKNNLYLNKNP